jgi:hypothetical protein
MNALEDLVYNGLSLAAVLRKYHLDDKEPLNIVDERRATVSNETVVRTRTIQNLAEVLM